MPTPPGSPTPARAHRLRSGALAASAAVLLVVTGLTSLGVPAATASPTAPGTGPGEGLSSAQLREEVDRLRADVERLEVAAEHAVEDYNEVQAEVDALMAAEVAAQVRLDDAGRQLAAENGAATRRVRALYRAGGPGELAWVTLVAGAPAPAAAGDTAAPAGTPAADAGPTAADAPRRGPFAAVADQVAAFRAAQRVLAADAAVVARADQQVTEAVSSSTEVQDLRRQRAAAEVEAAQRRQAAETALRERELLLAGTDAALVAAVERERQEEEARALAEALAQAEAAARAAALQAGGAGPVAGPSGTGSRVVGERARQAVDRAVATAPTPQAASAISAAATRLGLPYVWGATGPSTFDCSGLTMWSYRQAGVSIPRTSRQQFAGLQKVPVQSMLPGDLLFYADGPEPGSIHHVSIYLGDGLMLTAPRTGDVVKVQALWREPVYGAVRPVP